MRYQNPVQKYCWDLSISSIYHYASIISEVHISDRKQNSWIWVGIYYSESLWASAAHLHSTNAEISEWFLNTSPAQNTILTIPVPMDLATLFKAKRILLCSPVNLCVLKIFTFGRFQPFHKKDCVSSSYYCSHKSIWFVASVFQATWLQAEAHKQEISCKDSRIAEVSALWR